MRQQLIDLLEIQTIDLEILEHDKRREEIPAEVRSLEERINSTREQLTELTTQRDAMSLEIRTQESAVDAENEKIKKWERRLNEIRNQREYLALSREVEGSRRANKNLEEQILEVMTKRDDLESQIETLQDQLAEDEVDCEEERKRVEAELAEVEATISKDKARRDALVPNLPKNLIRKYESIRTKRVGVGLVAATGGSCKGCNMRLPPQLYIILQRANTIEQCPSCQRIVFFDGIVEQANGSDGAENAAQA